MMKKSIVMLAVFVFVTGMLFSVSHAATTTTKDCQITSCSKTGDTAKACPKKDSCDKAKEGCEKACPKKDSCDKSAEQKQECSKDKAPACQKKTACGK